MTTVPTRFAAVILCFAEVFGQRTWRWAEPLLIGAILMPGRRTLATVLGVLGLSGERHFVNYHRVLSRVAWSPQAAARPTGRLVSQDLADLQRRAGRCMKALVAIDRFINVHPPARHDQSASMCVPAAARSGLLCRVMAKVKLRYPPSTSPNPTDPTDALGRRLGGRQRRSRLPKLGQTERRATGQPGATPAPALQSRGHRPARRGARA